MHDLCIHIYVLQFIEQENGDDIRNVTEVQSGHEYVDIMRPVRKLRFRKVSQY